MLIILFKQNQILETPTETGALNLQATKWP